MFKRNLFREKVYTYYESNIEDIGQLFNHNSNIIVVYITLYAIKYESNLNYSLWSIVL